LATSLIARIDAAWYPGGAQWDDVGFRRLIGQHVTPESVVLDLGAGSGYVSHMNLRGVVARMCGVDLDPRVVDNRFLDDARVASAAQLPYEEGLFDVVFANNVLEHLADPADVFREVARVLRPGGVFLFKTPNRWHYVPIVAQLTPHCFHRFVNRLRGRAGDETFPTRYRANTLGAVRRLAGGAGLLVERIERLEGRPEYARMTWPTYVLGAAYERLVNASDALAAFRVVLMGVLRRPERATDGGGAPTGTQPGRGTR
jgi:SAM-dependent methyltransferase